MTEPKQHPKRRHILNRLARGQSVEHISRALKVSKKTVTAFRKERGLLPTNLSVSAEEKLARYSVPVDGHHARWTGRTGPSGTPVIRMPSGVVPAAAVAFELRTGRKPLGIVKAECGMKHCVAPSHVADERERRKFRMQERALYGMDPIPWDVCAAGVHYWGTWGRIEPAPSLTAYCAGCNSERKRAKKARITR